MGIAFIGPEEFVNHDVLLKAAETVMIRQNLKKCRFPYLDYFC